MGPHFRDPLTTGIHMNGLKLLGALTERDGDMLWGIGIAAARMSSASEDHVA